MSNKAQKAVTLLISLLAMTLALGSCAESKPEAVDAAEQRLWSGDEVPQIPSDQDGRSVEVGTEFTTASNGTITAVRFYQGPGNTADQATVWTSDGTRISSAPIPPGPDGWREIRLAEPVQVEADRNYMVSYHAAAGHYSTDPVAFAGGRIVRNGWLTALRGVFAEGSGFPGDSSQGTNYYVDVVFKPSGPTLRRVDGGEDYYGSFKDSFPTSPNFFPLGVWYTRTASPEDIASDRSLGINTYVMLSDDSNVQLIKDSGMFALTDKPNNYSAGQLLTDEADMWAGPGDAPWTGQEGHNRTDICVPGDAQCGYSVMDKLRDQVPADILTYANYGKGVAFWESRDQAEKFVNDFQNIVSVDSYWFSDAGICGTYQGGARKNDGVAPLSPEDCHLAANYGMTTKYIRSLVEPRGATPVWNFVELGHPNSDDQGYTITGPQMRAAVWSSIINGARGIIYFAHNFGGPCPSYNLLRDSCGDAIRADFTAVNQQIARLAPVLNAPFVDGYASSDGPVDIAVKRLKGENYILSGSTNNAPSDIEITLSCGNATSAEVIDENRTVPITNGSIHDTFADGNAVHLYRIADTDGCGLA